MSFPIHVDAYSGYKANERPESFTLDENLHEIAAIEVRRLEPDAEYFRVRTTNDKRYLLRYDRHQDEWTLLNDFDGVELLAELAPFVECEILRENHPGDGEASWEACRL